MKPKREAPPRSVFVAEKVEEPAPTVRFRFGLATLMLVTLMASIAGALFAHLRSEEEPSSVIVLLSVAAPLAVMFLFGAYLAAAKWLRRRRRPRLKPVDEEGAPF